MLLVSMQILINFAKVKAKILHLHYLPVFLSVDKYAEDFIVLH